MSKVVPGAEKRQFGVMPIMATLSEQRMTVFLVVVAVVFMTF